MVEPGELETGKASVPAIEVKRVISGAEMPEVLRRGGPVERKPAASSRFKAGDPVLQPETSIPVAIQGYPDMRGANRGRSPAFMVVMCFRMTMLLAQAKTRNGSIV